MLEPVRFSSPLEMYRLVCCCLVLASLCHSEVQSQGPCATSTCPAVRFPWKPLEFCIARLGEDMAAPSAILYTVFSPPFTFTPSLSSPALLQWKIFLVSLSEAQPDIARQEKLQFQDPCREKKWLNA